MHLAKNNLPAHGAPMPPIYEPIIGRRAPLEVRWYFSAMLKYQPTPMVRLRGLAHSLGVQDVFYKDEGRRFGFRSFKALGGSYAVARRVHAYAEQVLGRSVPVEALFEPVVRTVTRGLVVACATDGNHGASVAWGAQQLGCACVVFLHENVSQVREDAIAAYGARIIRVPGVYDDSVAEAQRVAVRNGWWIISDFASEPFDPTTGHVMQGYTLMVDEAVLAVAGAGKEFSHVFVQGGCGAMAASVLGHLAERLLVKPTSVVVEPDRANCLFQSAERGALTRIEVRGPTIMTMLECYEPSHMAWPLLERVADYFMDIPDAAAIEAVKRLASPIGSDPPIGVGVSGVAGVAGLIACRENPDIGGAIGLNSDSRVLVIGSEGRIE